MSSSLAPVTGRLRGDLAGLRGERERLTASLTVAKAEVSAIEARTLEVARMIDLYNITIGILDAHVPEAKAAGLPPELPKGVSPTRRGSK